MSQHDKIIDNASHSQVRMDLNQALAALASNQKGPTAPPNPQPGETWVQDTTPSATSWTYWVYTGSKWVKLFVFDTQTGLLSLTGAPTAADQAANKAYVDAVANTKQAALGFTPLNKAGDSLAGSLTFGGGSISTNGAINATFLSAPTTGAVYLGNSGTKYLYFDGTSYQLPNANLVVNGNTVVQTAGDASLTKIGSAISITNIVTAGTFNPSTSTSISYNTKGQITGTTNCNCNCASNCACNC